MWSKVYGVVNIEEYNEEQKPVWIDCHSRRTKKGRGDRSINKEEGGYLKDLDVRRLDGVHSRR